MSGARPVSRATGIAAAVLTIAIWTAFIVVARAMALRSLTPWDITLCRIVGASLVLLPWGAWLVRRRRCQALAAGDPPPAQWLGLSPLPMRLTVLCGLWGGLGYSTLAYAGFVHAPAAHGSVLMPGMLPLWTAVLSVLLLGERLGRTRMLALGLIVGGALTVGGASLLRAWGGGGVWKGDLLFMAASFSWSVYAVLMRRERLDPVHATIAITVFALLAYLPAYLLLAATGVIGSQLLQAPAWEVAFQALWQGIGSVVISGITFATMVRAFGPVRTTMMTALVPGLSAMGAVIFLGEPLGANLLAGLALVTLGIVAGVRAAGVAAPAAVTAPAPTPPAGR